ncbi:MAG: hypothetical protein NTX56_05630, partial [Proteobacteria bacterium]|nr:hypothetical protein [Pseudomonadota bacterium]
MPSVEIRIDTGGDDGIPHTFLVIDNGAGFVQAYGFGPAVSGMPWGPGHVSDNSTHEYQAHLSSGPIEISTEQYNELAAYINNSIANPPHYSIPAQTQCAMWVNQGLAAAGIWDVVMIGADPYAQGILQSIRNLFGRLSEGSGTGQNGLLDLEIGPTAATAFAQATTIKPALKDPLILDLNNNGLDTTGIDPNAPILFDHDGDGIKTATGWIRPADAFLVLDRNGNGSIDNGSELFGDATPLYADGLAADGFAALAQEDTNADGRVDAQDARFASLRLWTDLNQDGISQNNELFTLAQKGIAALIVAKSENSLLLGNGNQIADLGGFIRTDGSGGMLGAAEPLADVDLASNRFFSEFTDSIPLTAEAQSLPDMNGAGQVRSLQQAASLGTPAGAALATQLAAFASEPTRSGQIAQLDGLLKAWSDTSTMPTTATGAFTGVNLNISFAGVGAGSTAYQAWLDKLSILEHFNGQTFLPVPTVGASLSIDFYGTRELLLDQAYVALKESVYGALVIQTRLKPYLDSIELKIDENGITLDYTAMMARLETLKSVDVTNAVLDLMELQRFAGKQLTGWVGLGALDAWLSDPLTGAGVMSALVAAGLAHGGVWLGSQSGDYAIGSAGVDRFYGNGGDDVLLGLQGDDTLNGGGGDDVLDGGAGNDMLYGGDTLSGTGNDTYLFGRGDGQDTIIELDDTAGNLDTIRFKAGIAPSDVIATRPGNTSEDLLLSIVGTTDSIRVQNWFNASRSRVEQVTFEDG